MSAALADLVFQLSAGFNRILGAAGDLLLPPLCPACHVRIDVAGLLCGECWSNVEFISDPVCDRLGIPLPYAIGQKAISPAALAHPPRYRRGRAAAIYGGPVRDLVQALKYKDRQDGLAVLVRWLNHAGRELLSEADLIVPIPLHRWRLWSRRFNQAALLARRLSALSGVAHEPNVLERVRPTRSQVGMTAGQRRRNVSGAFRIPSSKRDKIAGRGILLVDDVLTTGATAEACARALMRAGAAHVDVLVLAMARPVSK